MNYYYTHSTFNIIMIVIAKWLW